jgi:hypothetical protein
MNDRPTAAELVAATRLYLEKELLPILTDARLRFQTLVAANVLSVVERELQGEEEQLHEDWEWLAPVLHVSGPAPQRLPELQRSVREAHEELCRQIRAGDYDEPARFQSLAQLLRRSVERKLEVANPRYLASFRGEGPEPSR